MDKTFVNIAVAAGIGAVTAVLLLRGRSKAASEELERKIERKLQDAIAHQQSTVVAASPKTYPPVGKPEKQVR
jgi:hypothetical protein